jgi:hypothetical protein
MTIRVDVCWTVCPGHKELSSGCWFWALDAGFSVLGSGFWVPGAGCRVPGAGRRVPGAGRRASRASRPVMPTMPIPSLINGRMPYPSPACQALDDPSGIFRAGKNGSVRSAGSLKPIDVCHRPSEWGVGGVEWPWVAGRVTGQLERERHAQKTISPVRWSSGSELVTVAVSSLCISNVLKAAQLSGQGQNRLHQGYRWQLMRKPHLNPILLIKSIESGLAACEGVSPPPLHHGHHGCQGKSRQSKQCRIHLSETWQIVTDPADVVVRHEHRGQSCR